MYPDVAVSFRYGISLTEIQFKCQGPGGRWHKHKRNCHPSKRDAISQRDAAFANTDLLNVDNSYIVITNADQFNAAGLEVLKNMLILPDDDSDHASFENGEQFYVEGEITKVSLRRVDTSLSCLAR